MGNCEVYGTVDFGLGPVTIRCTQSGEHEKHICQVFMDTLEEKPTVNRHNVFEQEVEPDETG